MSTLTRRLAATVTAALLAGTAAAGQFTLLNLHLNRAHAVSVFNERRATGAQIQSGEEIIRLASDGLQFQVRNDGPAAELCIEGEVYDMQGRHVIGTGSISTKYPVPTGITTLVATDFRSDTHFNADPGYNLMLEDKYRNSSGQDILQDLLAVTYRFRVWPCGDPTKVLTYYFTLAEPPYDPVRIARPTDGSSACPTGLQFAWFPTLLDGVPASRYRLEVFEGEDAVLRVFDSDEMLPNGIKDTRMNYPVAGRKIVNGQTYVWRVTATDSLGVRQQASRLFRFTADCEGRRQIGLSDLEAELRRSRPDLFAALGPVTLVSADSPTLGDLTSPGFQRIASDLEHGKAKVTDAHIKTDGEEKLKGKGLLHELAKKKPKVKDGDQEKPKDQDKDKDQDKPKDQDKGKDQDKPKGQDEPKDQGKQGVPPPDADKTKGKPGEVAPPEPDKPNLPGAPVKGKKP